MSDLDLDELRAELDEFSTTKKNVSAHSPREERIIAGFEDIERFFEQNKRLPAHEENNDIFERLYAVRLDKIRSSEESLSVLAGLDKHGILQVASVVQNDLSDSLDDDEILAELGALKSDNSDITNLKHVRPRAEINAAEEIAQRTQCLDFNKFKALFKDVTEDVATGKRITRQQRKDAGLLKAQIKVGDFFIINGQTLYIAEIGEKIKASDRSMDARLRVIYSNGTESNILLETLRRNLYKDETSRIISEPSAGPLFSDQYEDGDIETGTIYVLRSKSDHPVIKEHRDIIHKIGVTSGNVNKRISNAKLDPTFLMADVEIIATYELSNINRIKLEKLIHKFFVSTKLDIQINDRFGNPVVPREWFLVPIFIIDEFINKLKEGSVSSFYYNVNNGNIEKLSN